jgi:hypothetical protein
MIAEGRVYGRGDPFRHRDWINDFLSFFMHWMLGLNPFAEFIDP